MKTYKRQEPQTIAPAIAWNEDPNRTIFDGMSGLPMHEYEGPVLVFFANGTCYMRTWIENGERILGSLGTD